MPKETISKRASGVTKQQDNKTDNPIPESPAIELRGIAKTLAEAEEAFDVSQFFTPVNAVQNSAAEIGKSWCGSWLGFESRIYYAGLKPTPPGCYFQSGHSRLNTAMNSAGEWLEFAKDLVETEIFKRAKNPDLVPARKASRKTAIVFEKQKELMLAVLRGVSRTNDDPFFVKLIEDTEKLEIPTERLFVASVRPTQITTSMFNPANSQGVQTPPHIAVSADMLSILAPSSACELLARIARQAYSHIERTAKKQMGNDRLGTNVFIGHGNSPFWRELKDFINDRVHLPWDEFNRVPVAGITNIARLSEMLDSAAIAFVIMTAEDEQRDGKLHARMNVIHEVGLFQGRLGFTKAIVLLEEGCEQFSNIEGLGQIRFPKGKIAGCFEQVRQVLEREQLIS